MQKERRACFPRAVSISAAVALTSPPLPTRRRSRTFSPRAATETRLADRHTTRCTPIRGRFAPVRSRARLSPSGDGPKRGRPAKQARFRSPPAPRPPARGEKTVNDLNRDMT